MTQAMRFDVSATDRASATLLRLAEAIEKVQDKLKSLDRTKADPQIDLNDRAAIAKIDALKQKLTSLRGTTVRVDLQVGDGSELTRLRNDLNRMRDTRVRVRVDAGSAVRDVDRIHTRMQALKRMSPIKLELRVDQAGRALRQLTQLQAAAAALSRTRIDIQVSADVALALAQVTALLAQVRRLSNSEHTVRVRLDGTSALSQLARIQTELRALAGSRLEITPETRRMMEALALLRARLAELETMDPTVEVRAETAHARAEVAALELALARIAGRQYRAEVKVDTDKNGDLAKKLAKWTALIATLGPVAVASAGSATAALATLAGSLVSLAGLAPVAVGGLVGLAAVIGTVKLATHGLDEAFKNLEDPAKFAEALKELSPAAQEFAISVRDIAPAWREIRSEVQNAAFGGLGQDLRDLSMSYLPTFRTGLTGVARELGLTTREVLGFAQSKPAIRDVDSIFNNIGDALEAARPAATNLTAAFVDIAKVGSDQLPEMAQGWTNVTGRFREFISEARQSGQLEQWIQGGIDTLQKLGSIAGNTGSILFSVWKAADTAGADFLTTLDRGTEAVARFLRSAEGQNSLVAFFTESRDAIDILLPGLADLGRGALEAAAAFANTGGLTDFAAAASNIATQVGALLPGLGELAGGTLSSLASAASGAADVIGPLAGMLLDLANATGPVAPTVLAMVVAFAGLQKVSGWVAAAGASMGTFVGRLGGSEAAVSRVTSVITRAGAALPLLGVAAVAAAAGWDALTTSAQEASDAIQQGGAVGAAAARDLAAQGIIADFLKDKFGALGGIYDTLTTSTEEFAAGLDSVGKAQLAAAQAYSRYEAALKSGDPSRIAAAQAELATATDNVAAAQKRAADATKSASDRMNEQIDAARSLIGGHLDLENSLDRVAKAEKAANDARKGTPEAAQAQRDYVTAADQAAVAAQTLAEAQAKAAHATDPAAAGTRAYGATLLQLAATAKGPAQQALLGYIAKLDDSTLAALSAGAEASGFATKILTLPDGRTVKIAVDPETGKVVEVKTLLDSLVDKTIVINGNPVPAMTALNQVLGAIALGQGTVNINGNPIPVQDALAQILSQVNLANATVDINGNPLPAQGVFESLRAAIIAGSPTVDINGNPVPVQDVVTALLASITGSNPTITPVPNTGTAEAGLNNTARPRESPVSAIPFVGTAEGELTNTSRPRDSPVSAIPLVGDAEGQLNNTARPRTQTTTAQASGVGAVNSAIDNAARNRTSTITVTTTYRTVGVPGGVRKQSDAGGHAGGGVIGYSGGGLPAPVHAARGMVLPGYQPGVDTVPAVLSRGEAVLVPELVRQIGARNILDANAAASGGRKPTVMGRIPSGMMNGTASAAFAGRPVMSQPASNGAAAIVAAIQKLGDRIGHVENHFTNNFALASPERRWADEVASAQRTQAEMGAFGAR